MGGYLGVDLGEDFRTDFGVDFGAACGVLPVVSLMGVTLVRLIWTAVIGVNSSE